MPLAAELDISWVSFVLHVEQSSRHSRDIAKSEKSMPATGLQRA